MASFAFVLITLLFLDFTGTLHAWFGWIAKIQLISAVLALNTGVITALVLLTLLFGRIYCSVICPLGVFQDVVSWFAGKRRKNRFRYSSALLWLRYGVLTVFLLALIFGISSVFTLLEPYSAYGRIAGNLFAPVYQLGNNLLASFAERIDSYAFYSVDVWLKSGLTFIIAVGTLIVVAVLSWRGGRTYCNTICPVGSVLGFLSKYSLFRPAIDETKCNECGLCARNCKSSCIDAKAHKIDYSRCVSCMDCIDKCRQNAMTCSLRPLTSTKQPATVSGTVDATTENGRSRRRFLSLTALFAVGAALKAQNKIADGGLAVIEDKKIPVRKTPVVPAGTQSLRNMSRHCTACQLCVSVCPNQVLRPSSDLSRFMQPEMSFERGYCRPECVKCTEVCPPNAIKRITTADKSAIQIGRAVWIKENCVVNTDDVTCTNCARHCPTGAITLVPRNPETSNSLKIPTIDNERCIGCGACENLCPARPFSAVYVEGNIIHHTI
jgi:polyferredoxin